jgi:hypothetical protein
MLLIILENIIFPEFKRRGYRVVGKLDTKESFPLYCLLKTTIRNTR